MDTLSVSFDLTEARQSPIHGLGVFAKRDIPKGTVWWRGEKDVNVLLFNRQQYLHFQQSAGNSLKDAFWEVLATYSYYSRQLDSLIVCLDNARYVNHSDEPNSGPDETQNPLLSVALRDIKAGEEILENYDHYDFCPWVEILKFR